MGAGSGCRQGVEPRGGVAEIGRGLAVWASPGVIGGAGSLLGGQSLREGAGLTQAALCLLPCQNNPANNAPSDWPATARLGVGWGGILNDISRFQSEHGPNPLPHDDSISHSFIFSSSLLLMYKIYKRGRGRRRAPPPAKFSQKTVSGAAPPPLKYPPLPHLDGAVAAGDRWGEGKGGRGIWGWGGVLCPQGGKWGKSPPMGQVWGQLPSIRGC